MPTDATTGQGGVTITIDGTSYTVPHTQWVKLSDGRVVQVGSPDFQNRPSGVHVVSLENQADIPPPASSGQPAQPVAPPPAPPPASGGATTTSPPATSGDGPTEEGYRGVPEGGQLWRIDGRIYWGREIRDPITGEVEGFAGWWIPDPDTLNTLLGGQPLDLAFDGTAQQAAGRGFIDGGNLSEVQNVPGEDPLENFYEDWAEQLSLSPMYDNDEIVGLAIVAALEGREITENELQGTEWWRSQNDAQRAWAELLISNPEQARLIRENNYEAVMERFWQAGWSDVPHALVDRIAMQWTSGEISQADAYRQVIRETDPYAPGASPYAGLTDDAISELGWQVIRSGDQLYFRTGEGDYLINGPGGRARYEHLAEDIPIAHDGSYVRVVGFGDFFVTAEGDWYRATGPGQIAGLQRLYGDPEVRRPLGRMPTIAGSVVDLFGGPGGIETNTPINQVGTSDQLAGDLPAGRDTTGLGQEERVRTLLREYVGPYHAQNYSDSWVAEWAGRLRNEGEGAIDLLVQDLQRDFQSLFPGYDGNNLSYEGIAGSARGLWARYSGNEVDEEDAAWLSFLSQGPDAQNREGWLRAHGLSAGWAPVAEQMSSALQSGFGPQVRGSLV